MRRAAAAGALVLLACRPQPANHTVDDARPAADTLRGVLVIEGSDPYPAATLRTEAGRVVIDAPNLRLSNLAQLEVWVRGTRIASDRFRADDFRVRGANGVPAWDGVLRTGPDGMHLELPDGSRHQLRGAPSTFAQLARSRLWVSENPDGTVREYGVLQ